MKRSSGDKPIGVIEVSDDDSPSKQPPRKTVRKDAEQFASQAFLGMHQTLVALESNYQDSCRVAAEAQKRVALLEKLLEKKREASEDTEKEELKNRLTEVSAKLEEAMKKIAQSDGETQEKMQYKDKLIGDLQKKLAETSDESEKEKSNPTSREEQLKRLAKLEKDYQGVCRIANEYEMGMNEAKARVMELENIIDKKPVISPVVSENAEKNLIAELQKKLAETSTQLENERSDGAEREKKLQDSVHSLTQQLEAEKSRGREKNNGEIRQNRPNKEMGGSSDPANVDSLQPPFESPVVPRTKTPETTATRPNPSPIGGGSSLLRMSASPDQPRHIPVLLNTFPVQTTMMMHPIGSNPCALQKQTMQPTWPLIPARQQQSPTMSPNLCELFVWNETPGSIEFMSALGQLRSRYHPSSKEWRQKAGFEFQGVIQACKVCKKRAMANTSILSHFFSDLHMRWMSALNAGIPRATFEHWMERLDSIPKPVVAAPKATVTLKVNAKALKVLPQGTAATATTAATVPPKEPTPTLQVTIPTVTAVVSPTVADGIPATKVQVATVASTVSAPTVTPKALEVQKPIHERIIWSN